MTTRAGTLAALLAALGRPGWWILALAGFLVRGGILVFFLAIVTLPSPLALSGLLEPIIKPIYLGSVAPATVALGVFAVTVLAVWVVGGTWIAAATEVVLVRDAREEAADEGLPTRPEVTTGRLIISRVAAAHLLALVPFAVVSAIGSVQIYGVAYRELVNPSDGGSILARVAIGAWGPMIAILVTWVLGELTGGLAVRRIVLRDQPLVGAVVRAAGDLLRHPAGAIAAPLLTIAVLVVDLAAVLAAVSLVWSEVRSRLIRPLDEPVATALALLTLGAVWCLALLVTGLIDAWRSVALTFESERLDAGIDPGAPVVADGGSGSALDPGGTIGASTHRRPGDWSADDGSGSL